MTAPATAPVTAPLPTLPVHAIKASPTKTPWLVQQLWSAAAVGVIGGVPKACKSWLGLELAVSVASGTACLGRFPVDNPGPVVVYLAEDDRRALDQTLAILQPKMLLLDPLVRKTAARAGPWPFSCKRRGWCPSCMGRPSGCIRTADFRL
jgi:hypothetical protein